jgi:hypothetical protein
LQSLAKPEDATSKKKSSLDVDEEAYTPRPRRSFPVGLEESDEAIIESLEKYRPHNYDYPKARGRSVAAAAGTASAAPPPAQFDDINDLR